MVWGLGILLLLGLVTAASSDFVLSDQESEVYYRFAVVTGESLEVERDAAVTGDVFSNGDADFKKRSSVEGAVQVVGEIDLEGTVSGEVTEGADPLVLPEIVDEAALRALADRVFEKDTTFTDEVIDDVVFVDGTIRIRGNVNGRGTLIASRDVRVGTDDDDDDNDGEGDEDDSGDDGGEDDDGDSEDDGDSGGEDDDDEDEDSDDDETPEVFVLDPETRLSLITGRDIRIGKERPFRGVLRAGRHVDIEKGVAFEGVVIAERRVRIKKGAQVTFVDFDEVAPEITLLSPAAGSAVATATPEITVELADDFSGLRLDSLEVVLDGVDVTGAVEVSDNVVSFTPQPLVDASHSLEVAVSDHSDNEARQSFAFTTDTVAPTLTLTSPPAGTFFNTVPVAVAEYADATSGVDLATVALTLDGTLLTGCSIEAAAATCPLLNLVPGPHTVNAEARDAAGNLATASVDFELVIDNDPPVLSITAPTDAVIFNDTAPAIAVEYSDAVSGVDLPSLAVSIDGLDLTAGCIVAAAAATCSPPQLVEGSHTVMAEVSDVAGNGAVASLTFELVIDNDPPAIEITSPGDGDTLADPTVEVTGTVSDEVGVESVTVNGQPASVVGETFAATLSLAPGANTIIVEATDLLGNTGGASITVTVASDTTPPTLTFTAPRGGLIVSQNQPEISLTFRDDDSGVDTATLAFTVNGSPFALSCTVNAADARCTPSSPLPEGAIALGASLADVAGNTATASLSFVVDTVGVEISVDDPATGLVTRQAQVAVSGSVGPGVTSVLVNDVVASVASGGFTATVTLREGTNMVVALATKANGNTGTASIEVTRDIAAPIVKIDSPRNGLVAVNDVIAVTGLVNDIVSGGTNPVVRVNGVQATVAGGAFMVVDLRLVRGPNTIEAIATDAVGNVGRDSITVTFQPPAGARLVAASGNGQFEAVNQPLPEPLVVRVQDALGNPVAGRLVRFAVTRNSGTLRAGESDVARRSVQVPTDGAGRAAVLLTLGDTAGEGNNRVRATAVGVAGEVEFCATAVAAPPDKILMVEGDNQRGLVGHPLAMPLEALVVDADGNPSAGIDVTFEVVIGNGNLDGETSLVRQTNLDGIARAVLTLGLDPGINNNLVRASFPGLLGLPATFTVSGLAAGNPADTRLAGVVLDNAQTPIPGAVVTIAGTTLETVTDEAGQFQLEGVPVGHLELDIDPTGSPRPEVFPPLAFETVTVAGQRNTIGQPILIPALDVANSRLVGGSEDVTLTMEGVEGLTLTVFANSTTFPDGSATGQLTISQVHLDKVPMPPPSGTVFMPPAWTIQPSGVVFDPPARITIPNDGLPPGRVIDIFQFDHTLNEFINVGKGSASDDGFVIVSEPGFGVTRSGWGGCGQPQPPQTENEGPDCPTEDGQSPIENPTIVPPPSSESPNHGDGRYSADGEFRRNNDGTPRPHRGVDIAAEEGTPVMAAADGTVILACPATQCTQSGNQVAIEHADGTVSRYFHLQDESMTVDVGDEVSAGDQIGNTGTTGNAEGTDAPHLHFEIRDGGLTGDCLDPTGCL